MIAALLGGAIGVPYLVSHTASKSTGNHGPTHAAPADAWLAAAPTPIAPTPPAAMSIASSNHVAPLGSPGLEPLRMHPVEQVLRFDLTREWVYQNWDRKWTGPTDVGLTSVRVTLVSGTDVGSLAGALTYFFNDQGEIEHISFHGRTGDPARLVDFLIRSYEFEPVAGPTGERVYQVRTWTGNVKSELRTRADAVVRNVSPFGSTLVDLELARPGSKRNLPPRTPKLELP